jgi:two-component system phosphate regulon sensor histidine kinase PhoR
VEEQTRGAAPPITDALAEERRRFRAVLTSMAEGVLLLDGERRVMLSNPAAVRLLGLPAQSLGRSLLEVIRAPVLYALVEQARANQPDEAEFDAGSRRLRARAAPLPASQEVAVVIHDVTELRRLETMRRDFVANVSHELRTPLSVIRANAETLLGGGLADTTRAQGFVEALHRNAERLSALLSDLLDLSRIESGLFHLELKPVSVHEAVRQAVEIMGPRAEARTQALTLEAPAGLIALADEKALVQILLNLLDNAIKYTPEGGCLVIRAAPAGEHVRVEVLDDGPGIEPQHRERVFERFYRVDKGRSREMGGTGLGLSIVKNLVEALGGQVGVSANPPGGACFWFTLSPAEGPECGPAGGKEATR